MSNKKELIYFPAWTAGRKGYAERIRQVFQDYLNQKDLHFTLQRAAILDHLLQADRHLSQADIYKALRHKGVGKVTVFRMLKLLEECQLVERVSSPDGRPKYEVKMERPHHDHLVCIQCGAIAEVQWPEVEKIQERTSRKLGFAVLYHRHELFGKCKECQARAN